jgi:hypothetical protein
MSDFYDEPPEDPAFDPIKSDTRTDGATTKVSFELSGYDENRIVEMVVESLVRRAWKATEKRCADAIAARVDDRVDEILEETIRPTVERCVADGWTMTDQWGRPQKTLSLQDRVTAWLDEKYDSYRSGTRLQKIVEDKVNEALSKELAAELTRARDAFRAQVDGVLQAKLGESLRAALGLKS